MKDQPRTPITSRPQQFMIGAAAQTDAQAELGRTSASDEESVLTTLVDRFKASDSDVNLLEVQGPERDPRLLVVEMTEDSRKRLEAEFPNLIIEPNTELGL